MTPQQPPTLRDLFDRAITLTPNERVRFLELVAERLPHFHAELVSMLQAHNASAGQATEPLAPPPPPPPPAAPPTTRRASAEGQQIGAYKVVRELGRGGMGTVFLAVRDDDAFRKTVALKVINTEAAGEEFVRRFKQERQILAFQTAPCFT